MMRTEGIPLDSSCCNCLMILGIDSSISSIDMSSTRLSVTEGLQLAFNIEASSISIERFLKLCPLCGASLEKLLKSHQEFTRLSARGSCVDSLRKSLIQAEEEVEINEFECCLKQEPSQGEGESIGMDVDPLGDEAEKFVQNYEPLPLTFFPQRVRVWNHGKKECTSDNTAYSRKNENESSQFKSVETSSIIRRRRNRLKRGFSNEQLLENETVPNVIELDRKIFVCEKVGCNLTFGSLIRLRQHESKHSSRDRPFSCKLCATFYKLEKHLKKHNGRFHTEKKFDPRHLRVRQRNQKKTKVAEYIDVLAGTSYKCHLCPEVSYESLKEWVEHHKEVHGRDLGYGDLSTQKQLRALDGLSRPCPYCGKMRQTNYSIVSHIENVHLKIRRFSCDICQHQFYQKENLKVHIENMHSGAGPKFLCTLCGFSLRSKGSLERHEKIHLGELVNRFDCKICNSKFETKKRLSNHVATAHSEERPFTCEMCDAGFKIKRNLVSHKRIVHEKKLDKICEFCSKAFARNSCLKMHLMSVHKLSREAAFSSAGMKSGKIFRILPNGDRVFPEKPTKPKTCEFCGRKYVRREQLFTHLMAVHHQTQEQAKEITGLESKRNLLPGAGSRNKKTVTRRDS